MIGWLYFYRFAVGGWVGEGVDFGAKRVKDNLARDEESKNVVNKRERDRVCVCESVTE